MGIGRYIIIKYIVRISIILDSSGFISYIVRYHSVKIKEKELTEGLKLASITALLFLRKFRPILSREDTLNFYWID